VELVFPLVNNSPRVSLIARFFFINQQPLEKRITETTCPVHLLAHFGMHILDYALKKCFTQKRLPPLEAKSCEKATLLITIILTVFTAQFLIFLYLFYFCMWSNAAYLYIFACPAQIGERPRELRRRRQTQNGRILIPGSGSGPQPFK
jgi:hypothetical protein